jgi:hypothetical protein
MLDGLQVCDIDMNYMIDLPTIYTKDNMPVSSIHIPTSDELLKWPIAQELTELPAPN